MTAPTTPRTWAAGEYNNPAIAWLARLFDGGGTIATPRAGFQCQLTIEMNDEDIIRRIAEVAGVGTVRPSRSGRMWVWKVSAAGDAVAVLRAMLPWLGRRRSERALYAIERYERRELVEAPAHGTLRMYHRELRRGAPTCDECRAANREDVRMRRTA